jgi:hypothetical protein
MPSVLRIDDLTNAPRKFFNKRERVSLGGELLTKEDLAVMVGDGKGFIHLLVENEDGARKALEEAGIEVADEREAVIVDLHDKPGAIGVIARDLAEAASTSMSPTRSSPASAW